MDANWQALVPAYLAPESGQQLLQATAPVAQATAPVAQVAGNIGRDVEQGSGALKAYADEVRHPAALARLQGPSELLAADIDSYRNQSPAPEKGNWMTVTGK